MTLARILAVVRERAGLGHCALSRAYADWSDQDLLALRMQLNELGVEPVQVFGTPEWPSRMASGFEIVADAVELVLLRPLIHNCVIVAGDGRLAPLVRKLRGHGKRVVGCAPGHLGSEVFGSVCQTFVPLPGPEAPALASPARRPAGHDPDYRETALDAITAVLLGLKDDPAARADLQGDGYSIDLYEARLAEALPGFDFRAAGFSSGTAALREAGKAVGLVVRRNALGSLRLFLSNHAPILAGPAAGDLFAGLWDEIKPLTTGDPLEVIGQIVNILKWVEHEARLAPLLAGEGLSFHRLETAIARALPGLNIKALGLGTISRAVREACGSTGLTLYHPISTELRLVFRDAIPDRNTPSTNGHPNRPQFPAF